MGCRNSEDSFAEDGSSAAAAASSLSEALLLTTMCIIGLPVDVHVKDGSIYSGVFHTASVDGDYGIVLKKARMTKKGKGNSNVGKEGLVDMLVILSGDLVQVVANGVMLPADGVGGNITGNDEEAVVHNVCCSESPTGEVENHTGSLMDARQVDQSRFPVQSEYEFAHCVPPSIAGVEFEGKTLPVNQMRTSTEFDYFKTDESNFRKIEAASGHSINERQAGDEKSKGNAIGCGEKSEFVNGKVNEKIQSIHSTNKTADTCLVQVEAVEHRSKSMTSNPSDIGLFCNITPASVKADDRGSEMSTSADSASVSSVQGIDLISESHNLPAKSVEISAPSGTDSNRNPKGSKLNPAAKTFSPSFINSVPATATMPTAANMVYIPNSSPAVPVAGIQPEIGPNDFTYRPSLPVKIVGQLAHRAQPLQYGAHYTPVLSEPAYLQPSSPAVIVGRSGQLVYVHPVSHDLVHGATALPPISARPILNHAQFPKQQGGTVGQPMPICVPPPVLTSAQQPFALQSHIPFLQPGFPLLCAGNIIGSSRGYTWQRTSFREASFEGEVQFAYPWS